MNKVKTELKWAAIFALAALGWMMIERVAGLHDVNIENHAIYTNFYAFVAISVYVLALREKKKIDFSGSMSYKQAFISGLIMTGFITIFAPINQIVISYVISPNYFGNMIQFVSENGKMTKEAAEAYFNLPNYMMQVLIGSPIMGTLTTALVALFVKSRKK